MMLMLEKVSGSLELVCESEQITEAQFQKGMLLAVTGIFTILMILLSALVLAASNQTPWEENR